MKKIELLAPAGNLEKAKTAILYGADAVYIGGQQYSLRSRASNFDLDSMAELVQFAHQHHAHVHVTVNMFPHEKDVKGLKEYLLSLDKIGIDAIIVASPAIIELAKSLNLSLEIHVSTQHSITSSAAVKFWQQYGVDRVVLARECDLEAIESICQVGLPIEAFVHGGMCISFSGRCVLSNHMTNRDANRGGCAQSCRWKYHLYDQHGEISVADKLFSMSSKDLQAVDYVPRLMDMGVASLKIEGRMKSAYYLATVVSSYRRLIDWYASGQLTPERLEWVKQEIAKAENRPTGPGFYAGLPNQLVQLYRAHDETVTQEFVGQIIQIESDQIYLQVKNKFTMEDALEIFGPDMTSRPFKIEACFDEDGQALSVLNKPMQVVRIQTNEPVQAHAMIRKRRME